MVDKIDEVIRRAMEDLEEIHPSTDATADLQPRIKRKPLTQAKTTQQKDTTKRVYVPQVVGGRQGKPPEWAAGVKEIFPGLDSRTVTGMELNYGYCQICVDLGGEEHLSFIQKTLAKQTSFMAYMAASLALRSIDDETLLPTQQMVMRTMASTMKMLGLERLPKEIEEITLAKYLSDKTQ